ncbi:MAG: hypothetical protein L0211_12605 [Planctomycetaceae bacterium]|nr:hypothetical protein [Planctomycetaceae bacterium]
MFHASDRYSLAARCGVLAGLFLTVLAASPAGHAQQRPPQGRPSNRGATPPRELESPPVAGIRVQGISRRSVTFTPEREAAALTFVRNNRPELLSVLENLNGSRPDEYQRAICDFFWTSETLAAIRQDDPKRHDLALRTWRLETYSHLLTSQLARRPADAERLRAELEQTVQQLVDAQIDTSAYEVKRLEAQLRRAQDRHQRLAGRRPELILERMTALTQAIEQADSTSPKNPSQPMSPVTGVK